MTETEWRACTEATPMLEFLRGKVSNRKLRLFACACCRRIWHHFEDERSRQAMKKLARAYKPQALAHDAYSSMSGSGLPSPKV
jgi:hypothetical protein